MSYLMCKYFFWIARVHSEANWHLYTKMMIVLNIHNNLTMTTHDAFDLSNFKIYHFPKM